MNNYTLEVLVTSARNVSKMNYIDAKHYVREGQRQINPHDDCTCKYSVTECQNSLRNTLLTSELLHSRSLESFLSLPHASSDSAIF